MYVAETKDGSVKRKMDAVEVKDGCGEVKDGCGEVKAGWMWRGKRWIVQK